jgi:hypothetical protein
VKKHLSYDASDRSEPWAAFFVEKLRPPLPHIAEAIRNGPSAADAIPSVKEVRSLLAPGYSPLETGYTLQPDGSLRVAVLTPMPDVSPRMWDWWFGWHGSHDSRYKIWHPTAHLSAAWQDGGLEEGYIGRVSMIQEYIGKSLEKANIAFCDPAELGLPAAKLADLDKEVFICARLGYTRLPLDFGWLVHQVRRTEGGAEMRSRFWLGGPHVALRGGPPFASRILQRLARLPQKQAIELLQHCGEEMNHLAGVLPDLYSKFNKA